MDVGTLRRIQKREVTCIIPKVSALVGESCPTRRARGRLDSHRQNGFFVALGFIRFGSESRPASRR